MGSASGWQGIAPFGGSLPFLASNRLYSTPSITAQAAPSTFSVASPSPLKTHSSPSWTSGSTSTTPPSSNTRLNSVGIFFVSKTPLNPKVCVRKKTNLTPPTPHCRIGRDFFNVPNVSILNTSKILTLSKVQSYL